MQKTLWTKLRPIMISKAVAELGKQFRYKYHEKPFLRKGNPSLHQVKVRSTTALLLERRFEYPILDRPQLKGDHKPLQPLFSQFKTYCFEDVFLSSEETLLSLVQCPILTTVDEVPESFEIQFEDCLRKVPDWVEKVFLGACYRAAPGSPTTLVHGDNRSARLIPTGTACSSPSGGHESPFHIHAEGMSLSLSDDITLHSNCLRLRCGRGTQTIDVVP
ncbi:hypothetical protein TNCV_4903211 [Trichonephila clavipes]|nr:hypothetical protein TNCV_4903211 [Trichonephila clavipes]